MAKKNKKIVRYRRPMNINVGMIIFAIIFVYLAFSVYTYMKKDKVQFYEVVEGSIVDNRDHTGIILRQEETHYSERAGNVNYYIREGKRASVGTSIYSIDESGELKSFLASSEGSGVNVTDENLIEIKRQLSAFSMSFADRSFSESYDLQRSLEAMILEYVNFNALDGLDSVLQNQGIRFHQVRSDKAGLISYAIDGYEQLTPADISQSVFDRSSYTKQFTKAGDLIASGSSIYKVITSDKWSVVFPLTAEEAVEYAGRDQLSVNFTGANLTVDGAFSIMTGSDGEQYGKLDFNQYLVQFVSDRYVDFEIVSDRIEGLKIPVTAVTSKTFLLIPVDYLTQGGNSTETGFLKEEYSEAGTTVRFIPTELYYSNDEYYYIDMSEKSPFKSGDYVVKPNSTERYQLTQSDTLQGVYNINKGYTVFKQIEILNSNDEYHTVRKGMRYGLTVYDHIVLKADTVYEGALIYQ